MNLLQKTGFISKKTMNRKTYWCPKCGRMFIGELAIRNHIDSKMCKLNREKDKKKGLINKT